MTPNHELTDEVETKKKEALKNKQERPYQSFSVSKNSSNSFVKKFVGIDIQLNSRSSAESAPLADIRPEYVEHI